MRTILVVDDEWAIAEVLESLLSDEGYRVIIANNGRQALERLSEWPPDLIMLDFMMPVMDGRATLEALKGRPEDVRHSCHRDEFAARRDHQGAVLRLRDISTEAVPHIGCTGHDRETSLR